MKIALIQSELVWGDVEANLVGFDKKIALCWDCDLILLPEMFTAGCMMVKKSPDLAQSSKDRIADYFVEVKEKMLAWAARQDTLVVGSSVYREGKNYYNRLVAAFPDGHCQYYDKRHCFRMGGENEHFSAGTRQLVFDYRGIRIAAFICYDLRFPVWCRNVLDYDLALFVANWPESRREIWITLLKARAIENQAYVAGVNCVGTDNNGLRYTGDSMLVDARGNVVAAAESFQEDIVMAELDISGLQEFRKHFPVLSDRDIFHLDTVH